MQSKRYGNRVTQEVYLLPKGYNLYPLGSLCIPLGLHFIPLGYPWHTSWVTSIHSKRYTPRGMACALQEVYPRDLTCYPRGINPYAGLFCHTSWSAFYTSCRCRLGNIPLGLHIIPLGLHMHTSWVYLLIPLGVHAIPLGVHAIPLGSHQMCPYLLGTAYLLGCTSQEVYMQPKRYTQEV